MVRTLKLFDEESIDKVEALIESIVAIIEQGDLKSLEETIGDILEAGLFSVTVLQPNILLALFMIMQIIVTGGATLVDRDILGEEEAFTRARNICAKIWRIYGEVGHVAAGWDLQLMRKYFNSRFITARSGSGSRIFPRTTER